MARGERRAAGEDLLREPAARALTARLDAHRHIDARAEAGAAEHVMRPVVGLADQPAFKARRPRGIPEVGQPAPLLMRLMRHKTVLSPVGRRKERTREALASREAVVGPAGEVTAAFAAHVRPTLEVVAPTRVLSAPRGLRAGAPEAVGRAAAVAAGEGR